MTTQTKIERRTQTDTDDRPPDIDTVHDRYQRGELSDAEMEAAVEAAMEAYPPDGKRENIGEPAQFDPRYSPEELILRIVLTEACGGLFAYALLNPHTVPL